MKSKFDSKIYVGFSRNLERRLKQHEYQQVHTTKRMGKVECIYYEAFTLKEDALRREKYLKTTNGKRALKIMLKNTLGNGPIV